MDSALIRTQEQAIIVELQALPLPQVAEYLMQALLEPPNVRYPLAMVKKVLEASFNKMFPKNQQVTPEQALAHMITLQEVDRVFSKQDVSIPSDVYNAFYAAMDDALGYPARNMDYLFPSGLSLTR